MWAYHKKKKKKIVHVGLAFLDLCKLSNSFLDDLCLSWSITVLSSLVCSSIGEESFCREIFEQHIAQLKEQAKEQERKRKEEKVFN